MTYELKRLEKNTFELLLTIAWEEVKKNYDQVFNEVVAGAEIDGFRKGKAPQDLVAQKVDKNKLYEEVVKVLLPKIYSEAVQKENLKPIVNPQIETVQIEENKDWVFKAKAAEMPQVDLKNYKEAIGKNNAQEKIWVPGKDDKQPPAEDKNQRFAKNMDILLQTSQVDLADLLIENEVSRLLSELLDEIKRLGLTLDQYLASTGKSLENLKAEYREKAVATLKLEFLLEKIADEEKISVSDEDLEKAISEAKDESTKAALKQNRYQLAGILKRQKTLDFLNSL